MAKKIPGRFYNEQSPDSWGAVGSKKMMTLWTRYERKVYNSGWGEGHTSRDDRNGRRPSRKPEPKS